MKILGVEIETDDDKKEKYQSWTASIKKTISSIDYYGTVSISAWGATEKEAVEALHKSIKHLKDEQRESTL